ncbi:sirohydrochlorin cobaltochelatase [Clostridium sp.]|uniref:sirohydrochlorin cobaltochelatase n=1 Tax=Clostridium sp. TaxID=1506 RepID=UPI002A91421E|nr:sirohydrochlorin cobaltochelatase [Clostridium sp.]MDY6012547.1 sirohydrochlorin cobaltochelatase [Clostridium sp.]
MKRKKAIVIVAFGTSKEAGFNKYLLPFKKDAEKKCGEEFDYFFALTNEKILSKLEINAKSYEEVLKELKTKKYEEVYVETLYFSRGHEYSKVEEITQKYKSSFKVLKITKPILEENENLIDKYFDKYDNMLFVCHGSVGIKNSLEEKYIKSVIKKKNKGKHYVVLIHNKDCFNDIIASMKNDKVSKVTIIPMFITKGYHFKKDIISKDRESFVSKLKEQNIEVEVLDKTLGESENFRRLVLKSLDNIIKN